MARVARRWASSVCVSLAILTGCLANDEPGNASGACAATSRYPDAIGCAYLFGTIADADGQPLDSIEGLVRPSIACACSLPRIEGDERGTYAVQVHRLPRPEGFSDTATVTAVVLASAPKYPRHVTGAAYFDTLRLTLRFAPLGVVPPPTEANFRIPLPPK